MALLAGGFCLVWIDLYSFIHSFHVAPPMPSDLWQFWAHRTAHVIEYGVLGVLVIRAYSFKGPESGCLPSYFYRSLFFRQAVLMNGTSLSCPAAPANCWTLFLTLSAALGACLYIIYGLN